MVSDDNEVIKPPWDAVTVEALNAFQRARVMHPFTCPRCSPHLDLRATPDGWVCDGCDYTQVWAHPFMLEERARTRPSWRVAWHDEARP